MLRFYFGWIYWGNRDEWQWKLPAGSVELNAIVGVVGMSSYTIIYKPLLNRLH